MLAGGREAALKAVAAWRKSGAWADNFLNNLISKEGLDKREAALASRIAFGVLQNLFFCDYVIGRFSTVSINKIEPMVMDILRISVYQIAFLDKIPDHAVINESVELTKKYSNKRAAGFVNAVLRGILRNKESLFEISEKDDIKRLSIRYSHPEWMVKYFAEKHGLSGCEELLKAHNTPVPTQIQTNTLKTTAEKLENSLNDVGISFSRHPYLEGCFEITSTGSLENLDIFKDGCFYVQDAAAFMAVMAAEAKPGMNVIDGCSAPGGKTFTASMFMKNEGSILSCDFHGKKLNLIEKGADRLGMNIISTKEADGRVFIPELESSADLVIADVPCSGIGVIRKKPEIRFKKDEELKGLPEIQYGIISNLSRYVKPGGTLLYSTCTVLERENEGVTDRFLKEHPEFHYEDFSLPCPEGKSENGHKCLWPHINGTDGFYICKLRKEL